MGGLRKVLEGNSRGAIGSCSLFVTSRVLERPETYTPVRVGPRGRVPTGRYAHLRDADAELQSGATIYGRYGFADAFHPTNGSVNPGVIGIDLGITLLSVETLRTGRVWKWFMMNPEIPLALERAGVMPRR